MQLLNILRLLNSIILLQPESLMMMIIFLQTSDTHEKMVAMLRENHFEIQEFILSPLQFAVPYSRPRYFCLVSLSLSLIFFFCE